MKRKATGITFIFVSGILAYLALAIMFWQSAMAAPLGAKQELDADTLGFWHEYYNSEEYNGMAIVAIAQMLKVAVNTRVYEECRDRAGEVSGECFTERQPAVINRIVAHMQEKGWKGTNSDLVERFWQYAIGVEWDEAMGIDLCVMLYISKLVDYLEPRS